MYWHDMDSIFSIRFEKFHLKCWSFQNTLFNFGTKSPRLSITKIGRASIGDNSNDP